MSNPYGYLHQFVPHSQPSQAWASSATIDDSSIALPPSMPSNLGYGRVQERSRAKLELPGPITDEEGYSDDDEQPNDDKLLKAYKTSPPSNPSSIRYHHVAVTGILPSFPSRQLIKNEIERFGGIMVSEVTTSTTLLLAPHTHPRSKKAHQARSLGLPIMNEAQFLALSKLELAKKQYASDW